MALTIHPNSCSSSSSDKKAYNRTAGYLYFLQSTHHMLLSQHRDPFPCAVKHDSDYLHRKLQITCAITWWVFLESKYVAKERISLRTQQGRYRRSRGQDACILTTATSATSCVMNTDEGSGLHCGAVMVTADAVVPSFSPRTSWGQAWSGLPTPTAAHGSRSCGRTRLVSSVSVCVHRRASPTSTCLSVWRFHSAGRDLPCPKPNE